MDYNEYIQNKNHVKNDFGFEPLFMPDFLFDFQKHLVEKNCVHGRFADIADCGLGKTPISLVFGENVIRKTNKKILLCTPLSVSYQFEKEAEKFGIEAKISRDGKPQKNITITNYEKLHLFNPNDFIGFIGDEASIMKNFKGKTKATVTEFIKKMPYRLLATATAAPNDFIELGTLSEALGYMGYIDMLGKFFKNAQNNCSIGRHCGKSVEFAFRGHAEKHFWRWVCHWAISLRKPSDLGFDDGKFELPPLIENNHVVDCTKPLPGKLFVEPAKGFREQRAEIKQTLQERCLKAAELCENHEYSVIWCHLNPEGDLLEKLIPDSVQMHGRLKDEQKEEIYRAFSEKEIKKLIIKPKMGAFGLNWQHCGHSAYFISNSYEQYYQGIRRLWRFGRDSKVVIDRIMTPGLDGVLTNLNRKARQASIMFDNLIKYMNMPENITIDYDYDKKVKIPSFLLPN